MAIGIWLLLAGASWCSLTAYGFKRDGVGLASAANAGWPQDSHVPRHSGGAQLLVFIHPKCPCSHATITELEKVFAEAQSSGSQLPHVAFIASVPRAVEAAADWRHTRLLDRAAQVPNAEVVFDAGGVEAQRFAADTSGTVMFFNPAGRCLYAGGVTAARGHEGPNTGSDTLARLLRGDPTATDSLPALGCRLVTELSADCPKECTPQPEHDS